MAAEKSLLIYLSPHFFALPAFPIPSINSSSKSILLFQHQVVDSSPESICRQMRTMRSLFGNSLEHCCRCARSRRRNNDNVRDQQTSLRPTSTSYPGRGISYKGHARIVQFNVSFSLWSVLALVQWFKISCLAHQLQSGFLCERLSCGQRNLTHPRRISSERIEFPPYGVYRSTKSIESCDYISQSIINRDRSLVSRIGMVE